MVRRAFGIDQTYELPPDPAVGLAALLWCYRASPLRAAAAPARQVQIDSAGNVKLQQVRSCMRTTLTFQPHFPVAALFNCAWAPSALKLALDGNSKVPPSAPPSLQVQQPAAHPQPAALKRMPVPPPPPPSELPGDPPAARVPMGPPAPMPPRHLR